MRSIGRGNVRVPTGASIRESMRAVPSGSRSMAPVARLIIPAIMARQEIFQTPPALGIGGVPAPMAVPRPRVPRPCLRHLSMAHVPRLIILVLPAHQIIFRTPPVNGIGCVPARAAVHQPRVLNISR